MSRFLRFILAAGLVLLCGVSSWGDGAVKSAHLALSGRHGVLLLDAGDGVITASLEPRRTPAATAMSDRQNLLWVLTRDRYLKAYDYQGNLQLNVQIPSRIVPTVVTAPEHRADRDDDDHRRDDRHDKQVAHDDGRRDHDRDIIILPHDIDTAVMAVDKLDNGVWIGIGDALLKYSAAGGLFKAARLREPIRHLAFDWKTGALWAASDRAITRLDSDAVAKEQLDLGRWYAEIENIAFDDRLGGLWVGLRNEIRRYNRDDSLAVRFDVHDPDLIAPDGQGNLWVSGRHSLIRYDSNGTAALQVQLPRHRTDVRAMTADLNTAALWLLTENALYRIDSSGLLAQVLGRPAGDHDGDKDRKSDDKANDKANDKDTGARRSAGKDKGRGDKGKADSRDADVHADHDNGGKTKDEDRHHDDDPLRAFGPYDIVANGDINPPVLTIDSPAAGTLVRPRPAIEISYTDVGVGVDPSATVLKVNGKVVKATCQGDGGKETCTPDAALTADPLTLTLSVGDYAGNRSAEVSVQVLLDTDGDGHDDNHDTYPTDPTRWRLAPVPQVTPSLQDSSVRLDWAPEVDSANTAGYYVYRTEAGSSDSVRLTANLLDAVHYVDAQVSNGAGYSYHVVAVDHKGNEGDPGTAVNFFVAYNHTPVTGLAVKRVKVPGQLNWDAVQGMRYRVYRGEKGTTPGALAETTTPAYLDSTVLWNKVYDYQVATIADFVDVFTQKPLHVTGPLSAPVELPALPPLSMKLDEGVPGADGVPELLIEQSSVSVTGSYQQAVGPVDIIAVSGTNKVTASSSDGTFHLVLPGAAGALWTITISEQTVADRDVQAQLRLIKDTVPPVITLDSQIPTSTDKDSVTLSGTAVDQLTGVSQLYAQSARYSGQNFSLIQGAGGAFYGDVPLDYGTNALTVHAEDGAGNSVDKTLTVTRQAALQPTLVITSPASGSTVDSATVDVSGVVYTGLSADKVSITLGGQQQFPSSGDGTQGYPFDFSNVHLNEGYNPITVAVTTPAGSAQQTIGVTYQNTPPQQPVDQSPTLDITSPTVNTNVNGDSVTITGSVSGNSGNAVSLTINGQPVSLIGQTSDNGNFQYVVDLSACNGGSDTVTLVATDATGHQTTKTITLDCDRTPPALQLSGLQLAPVVNHLADNPYVLQGTVSDAHLAGLTVNGQTVPLLPGAGDSYSFSVALQLPLSGQVTATFDAWDAAGNHTSEDYILAADASLAVEFVAPHDGDTIQSTDSGASVDVVTRIHGLQSGQNVSVSADGGAPQAMTLDGTTAYTTMVTSQTGGQHQITVQVAAADGTVLTRSSVNIALLNSNSVPLALDRSEPANGATGIAPNAPINLYFNKVIDPSKLSVSVKETVHGMDYDLSNQVGVGFSQLPKPTLVRVDHDMQSITGGIRTYPGNRFVTFELAGRLAYGGNEYVDVSYDGASIGRFAYHVQSLPTIVGGAVCDQNGIPIGDLTVQLPRYNLTVKTDSSGNFSFGSGAELSTALPEGRYAIVINPGMQNPDFGTVTRMVSVTQNRINNLGRIRVPQLDSSQPFVRIEGGESQALLAGGSLTLDLSQATLVFPGDGGNVGNVHADFQNAGQFSFPMFHGAMPQWLFSVQPGGIVVQGSVGLRIEMPLLFGNYLYVPPTDTLVALLALNPDTQTIEPIGVGRVDGHTVVSVTPIALRRLDYLGYALMTNAKSLQVLADYRDGKIASLAEFQSALTDASGF